MQMQMENERVMCGGGDDDTRVPLTRTQIRYCRIHMCCSNALSLHRQDLPMPQIALLYCSGVHSGGDGGRGTGDDGGRSLHLHAPPSSLISQNLVSLFCGQNSSKTMQKKPM